MTKQEQTQQPEWEEYFDSYFPIGEDSGYGAYPIYLTEPQSGALKDFIRAEIEAARREAFEEAIKLSDEIECAAGDTTMPEWKAFKHFRNTLSSRVGMSALASFQKPPVISAEEPSMNYDWIKNVDTSTWL